MANLVVTTMWLSRDFTLAGHALLPPSTAALAEHGGNYIPAPAGFTPAEQMILHYPPCLGVIPTAFDRNIC